MAKSHLKLVTPATVKRTVIPKRPPNKDLRTREHLTESEVERLMDVTKGNRHGQRDAAMVLVAYRHGLRASELVDLRWDQVDFRTGTLHVPRCREWTEISDRVLFMGRDETHCQCRNRKFNCVTIPGRGGRVRCPDYLSAIRVRTTTGRSR